MPYLKRWPHTADQAALANWRAARANAASQPVDIVYYGNSLTQSGGTGPLAVSGGYPSIVGNWMNAKLGKQHGVGFDCARVTGGDLHWTYDNMTNFATYNPGGGANFTPSTSGHTAGFGLWTCALGPGDTMTYTQVMDRCDLLYIKTKTNGTTVEVRIDGDLKTTLNTLDASQVGTELDTFEASNMWTSDAMANAEHVVTVTNAGANVAYIEGIYAYNTNYDSGFRFWNGAHSGYWGAFNRDTPNSYDIIKRLQPALAVWSHFYNDRNVSDLAYTSSITDFISKVRTYSPNTDIILCTDWRTQRWLPSHQDYDTMRISAGYIAFLNQTGFLDLAEFIEPVGYNTAVTDPLGWCMNVQPNGDREHQTVPHGFHQWAKIHWAYLNDVKPPSRPQVL